MPYIYHMIPRNMRGETLYPLNLLKPLYPDIYEQQLAKYSDHPSREKLPQKMFPKLKCLWNDVVQCSPIHPYYIYTALSERGFNLKSDMRWFQIPLTAVRHLPVAVRYGNSDPTVPLAEDEVQWLDFESYQELTALPAQTLAWYDHLVTKGQVFWFFVGVPHILVQGCIDTRLATTITWASL